MSDTVHCPRCNNEFYHENREHLTCPECNSIFQRSVSGLSPLRKVAPLAYGLIVLGAFAMLVNVGIAGAMILMPQEVMAMGDDPDLQASIEAGRGTRTLALLVSAVTVYPLMIFGASRMKNGRSYSLSVFSCVIAILPCSPTCVLGIFLGIGGLIALTRPDIQSSFR